LGRNRFEGVKVELGGQQRLSEFVNSPEGRIQKNNSHLLVRNMALMYALQWAILGLTVVTIVVSAASAAD
jgi:hypothetical protein